MPGIWYFQLAEVAVPKELFRGVLERIGRLCPATGLATAPRVGKDVALGEGLRGSRVNRYGGDCTG